MGDKTYSADDIVNEINDGNKKAAIDHLNYDFLHMSPSQFKKVVEEMEKTTKADDTWWTTHGNNVRSEKDKDGNISKVYIADGYIWDTKMLDSKDYKGNLLDPLGAVKRGLGGALDLGKEK